MTMRAKPFCNPTALTEVTREAQGDMVGRQGRGALHSRQEHNAGERDFLISVPIGTKRRIESLSSTNPLVISEVQIGEYCEENDIIRYEDDFGRGAK